MAFDALATAAMVAELEGTILDGRVQQVVSTDPLGIGLEVYANRQRHYLYATAHAQGARAHLVPEKLRRGVEAPSPFLLLLRKYVRGGMVSGISQPAFERIIKLDIATPLESVSLYIEVMGRHSNLILVDSQNQVMDSVKRVPPTLSRRVILPKHDYTPPPPQDKISYASLTPGRLWSELAAVGGSPPLWRRLVTRVAGVSPLLAREVVYRVTREAEALEADPAAILAELAALFGLAQSGGWQPSLGLVGERLAAYAPYPLTQFERWERVASLSQAVVRYHAQARREDGYAEAKKALFEALAQARSRLDRRRGALERAVGSAAERDEVMQKGQLILAYSAQIAPGQRQIEADWIGEEPLTVELDPTLSPSENAQRYFREYEKLKSAAEQIPRLLAELAQERAYLDQLETDLMLAANRPEIEQVRASLMEAGLMRTRRQRKPPGSPLGRFTSTDGFTVWVGKNSQHNERLTFGQARGEDLWLHAQGIPGSHVVVVTEGRQVPQRTLQQAAEVAAYYSRGRGDTRVAVDYTLVSQVRRMPGGRPGQVTYRRHQTLQAQPVDWLSSPS